MDICVKLKVIKTVLIWYLAFINLQDFLQTGIFFFFNLQFKNKETHVQDFWSVQLPGMKMCNKN